MRKLLVLSVGVLLATSIARADFTAYNDFITNYGANANVTTWGMTGGSNLALKDVTTGATVAPQMSVAYQATISGGTGPTTDLPSGTDAYNLFAGKVNTSGQVVYYGSASTWWFDVTFTGLNPAKKYTFASVIDRGDSSYANQRWTTLTLSGADAYTYDSSSGAFKVSDAEVSVDSYNSFAGYVAKWSNISAGSDGTFMVRYQSPVSSSEYPSGITISSGNVGKGYAPAGIMLSEVPEPATMSLLALGALALLRRRK
jgi:hypothetical protein